jgi:hypothetical protein
MRAKTRVKSDDGLANRIIGLSEPAPEVTLFEAVLTVLVISVLLIFVLVFWPNGGSFIYEGF